VPAVGGPGLNIFGDERTGGYLILTSKRRQYRRGKLTGGNNTADKVKREDRSSYPPKNERISRYEGENSHRTSPYARGGCE